MSTFDEGAELTEFTPEEGVIRQFEQFAQYADELVKILQNQQSQSTDSEILVKSLTPNKRTFDLTDYPNIITMDKLNAFADDTGTGSYLKGREFRNALRILGGKYSLDFKELYKSFAPFFAINSNASHNNEYIFFDPRS
ncbi:MAG: hypothetical protein ABI721_01845 [Candidatus Dojkabacteria bacterium]